MDCEGLTTKEDTPLTRNVVEGETKLFKALRLKKDEIAKYLNNKYAIRLLNIKFEVDRLYRDTNNKVDKKKILCKL